MCFFIEYSFVVCTVPFFFFGNSFNFGVWVATEICFKFAFASCICLQLILTVGHKDVACKYNLNLLLLLLPHFVATRLSTVISEHAFCSHVCTLRAEDESEQSLLFNVNIYLYIYLLIQKDIYSLAIYLSRFIL